MTGGSPPSQGDGGQLAAHAPTADSLPAGSVAASLADPAAPIDDMGTWHRLHPLSPLVSAGSRLAGIIVILLGIAVAKQRQASSDLIGDGVVIVIVLAAGVIRWLVTRWQVAQGVLRVETGLLRRDSRRFPLSQVQAIDVVQSGLARVLGLAELRLRVAGGDASRGGRLACLRRADAERLRAQLLALAGTAASTAPVPGPVTAARAADPVTVAAAGSLSAAEADPAATPASAHAALGAERTLFRVRPGRLAAAVLLSDAGLGAALAAGLLIIVAEVSSSLSVVASFLPVGLGAVLGTWRQFSAEFATTVADAPDGLRLRSGLIQTSAETIRPGRVQAVRLVEPLIWRALGWCRLEVDIAGPREHGEDRSEGRRLRTLIPVGSRADAEQMMNELLIDRPRPLRRPPAAARWKAPLSYHFLGSGGDQRYVVAARGRVCRKTTWVPLEKVQSIRWVQGPVQRRLGLATIRLDVAGRRVTGDLQDRAAAEAAELLARLPDLARAARARSA
ncbi:MAG: PH domain-containing protein [Streptosporangiaceae bacterium]